MSLSCSGPWSWALSRKRGAELGRKQAEIKLNPLEGMGLGRGQRLPHQPSWECASLHPTSLCPQSSPAPRDPTFSNWLFPSLCIRSYMQHAPTKLWVSTWLRSCQTVKHTDSLRSFEIMPRRPPSSCNHLPQVPQAPVMLELSSFASSSLPSRTERQMRAHRQSRAGQCRR